MWLYAVLPVQFVERPCLAYKRGLAKSVAALLAALPCQPSCPPAAARTKAGNSVGTEPVGRQGHTNHTGCFICVSSSPATGMSCIACQLATHCLHWQRFYLRDCHMRLELNEWNTQTEARQAHD